MEKEDTLKKAQPSIQAPEKELCENENCEEKACEEVFEQELQDDEPEIKESSPQEKPNNGIVCRDCLHALPPVQIWGVLHERFSFVSCAVFENKPEGILTKGDNCPLYKKREEK